MDVFGRWSRREILADSKYRYCGLTRTLGWNGGLLERGRRKEGDGAGAMDNKVVRLQINTADIMAMNRVDRIVLDPNRTYACTRTGERVTPVRGLILKHRWRENSLGCWNDVASLECSITKAE